MEISQIECPFKPLMAGREGSDDEDDQDLMELVSGLSVFEGKGQGFNLLGIIPSASETKDPWDLQGEVAELRFQNQKLTEECTDLKQKVASTQDENLQLLSQKDDLEKRLSNRNVAQEKIKQLQRELKDANQAVSSADDFNSVLSSRIHRLERDYSELETKHKDLQTENDLVTAEIERCFAKSRQKNEEIERIKKASEDVVKDWVTKVKWLEDRLSNLNGTLNELTETNGLRKEKFELETNLIDLSESQLIELNQSTESGNTESPIMSPRNENGRNQSYLRRSLHAEISATMERRRSLFEPLFLQGTLVDASTQYENYNNPSDDVSVAGAGPRRMSSFDKGRPRLVRMPNAMIEDESSDSNLVVGEEDEAIKSDNDYLSAASSLPASVNTSSNNLERPLQLSGAYGSQSPRNGDSDSVLIVSDGNNGSPIPSSSSPTQTRGLLSQETITNHDGDKTPVNDDGTDKYEALSCPGSSRPEYENGTGSLKKRGSSWGPSLPMYNRDETFPIGVIPDYQREHMIKYAYDPVRRSSEKDATILPGSEWRTLRKDLDKQAQDNYRKRFAQEEGKDVEGSAMDSGSQKPYNSTDLDDEAEEYLELFPDLVEQLFKNLDRIKAQEQGPSEFDLETISKRFNHLALTFKTEDINLAQRIELKLKEHDTSKSRMQEIIFSLSNSLQKLEDVSKTHKVPEEMIQLSSSLKHVVGDLHMHSNNLSRTSRRVGMMDVQIRLYKMIEVMVLYVNILRNLYDNVENDFQNARKALDEHNISFSSSKPAAKLNNNNNNNEKVSWDNDQDGDVQSERNNDKRPNPILQRLLGPKKSNAGLAYKLKESMVLKKKSSTNVVIRYIADSYEALRCELFWPWNWEETWRGIKQGFSIILMIVGLFIIFRSVVPIVSANSEPQPMIADLSSVFSKHGNLNHIKLPPV